MNSRYLLTIAGVLLMANLSSQDSLTHYLDIAVKNNPAVLLKFNEYKAALQRVPQAGSLPDPEISAGIFLSPMELVMGKQVADLRLMQMFPWFGTLRNARDEMSLMASGAYEALTDAKLLVYYEVQSNWFNLYKLCQNIRLTERNILLLQSIERIALTRLTAATTGSGNPGTFGSVPSVLTQSTSAAPAMGAMSSNNTSADRSTGNGQDPMQQGMTGTSMTSPAGSSLTDLYRIQIEAADMNNKLETMRNELKTLTARFNSSLNRPPDSPVVLPDTISPDIPAIMSTKVSDSVLQNNPMLKMLQFEQESLEARKSMVRKMGYPMLGVGLNYSVVNRNEMITSEMNGKDMIMPMISLTLPVYRKKYRAMQAETGLIKDAVIQNYTATANSLRNEYYQALQAYQDAKRRIDLYRQQNELTQKTFHIMMQGFAVTGYNLTDVLRVRQQLLDYEYKQVEAMADLNISAAWLNRLTAEIQLK